MKFVGESFEILQEKSLQKMKNAVKNLKMCSSQFLKIS